MPMLDEIAKVLGALTAVTVKAFFTTLGVIAALYLFGWTL